MLLVSEPNLGEAEKAALTEVIDSNWITMGSKVRDFEKAFAEHHGLNDAVALCSCTAGLHLVLAALEIGPGDQVLVPSMSFVATANCVLYVGATPVFVDISDINRPLMSIEDAERKCNRQTRAVIIMHYGGYLADRPAWQEFARAQDLYLIEDAAHAAGAVGAGTFGHAAVFSFYGNKNMTTAEGGMVTAPNPAVLERVRMLRGHGMSSGTHQRLHARAPTYDVTALGWNYRMDELRAAIGITQLASLAGWNAIRSELSTLYRELLARHCPDVTVPFTNINAASAHHLLPAVLPASSNREAVMGRMRDQGVQTSFHYPPIHQLSFYRANYPSPPLPRTEAFACRELTLPLHSKLSTLGVAMVVRVLADALTA
jgi:dTDP-4-amino-4,6-dideoxygalactose transaminase